MYSTNSYMYMNVTLCVIYCLCNSWYIQLNLSILNIDISNTMDNLK